MNIRNGITSPDASAIATSSHHSTCATAKAAGPSSGGPKAMKPLTMVANPIGIAPKNIDITEWPKIRRAPSKKKVQRAR